MTPQDIVQIISTVGFPIVCCGACFWYIVKTGSQHKEEMDKMSAAINNNTIVMEKILTAIGNKEL